MSMGIVIHAEEKFNARRKKAHEDRQKATLTEVKHNVTSLQAARIAALKRGLKK